MTTERFALILTSAALLVLGTLRATTVTNITDSMPLGLYLRTFQPPARGVIVELRPLVKNIAAMEGDTIRITPQGTYVNDKLWPNSAIPSDTHGYIPFRFGTYKLQPNQFWVLGDSPDSLDSRYFGFVSADEIGTTIKPLWTK
jgi:type IV secretory pathway protease TraF